MGPAVSHVCDMTSLLAGAAAAAGRLLAVPLGATEQHGPHLPLTTDSDIATALAGGLSRVRDDVVAASVLPFGASGEHEAFPGTLSIGEAALEALLIELGRSASRTFRRILFVSAHGGNARAVRQATARLLAEGRNARAWSPGWRGDAHAGRIETSLMLHLAPERVRMHLATAGNLRPVVELMPQMRLGGVAAVSSNGVLGDPAGASAGEGAALLQGAIAELSDWVSRWPAMEAQG
jgi:mycofactocin precursor peptide peptidase